MTGFPPPGSTLRLYHWTCEHSAAGIRRDMLVRPESGVSWWTDLDTPGKRTRQALGLTSHLLTCDRMLYRCEAQTLNGIIKWPHYLATETLDMRWAAQIETADGVKPEHWWVARDDIAVRSVRRMAR